MAGAEQMSDELTRGEVNAWLVFRWWPSPTPGQRGRGRGKRLAEKQLIQLISWPSTS